MFRSFFSLGALSWRPCSRARCAPPLPTPARAATATRRKQKKATRLSDGGAGRYPLPTTHTRSLEKLRLSSFGQQLPEWNDSLLSAAAHTPRITRSIGTDRQLGPVLRMTTTMLPKNHCMRGVRALWQSCGSAGGGLASAGRGARAAAHRTRAPRACSLPSSAMLYSLLHLGGFPGDVEFYRGRTAGVARMLDLARSRPPLDTPLPAP